MAPTERPPRQVRQDALRVGLVGLVVALLVAGPALGPGILLNLDLVVGHDPPVPPGVWGLGPELPRSLTYGLPLAWLGALVDGALVGKLFLVATLVGAFVGAHRLAAGAPALARIAAGLAYAAGPFLATRLAIGHWGTALAAALLPFALPRLLRPADDVARTLLWCAALGVGGVNGGILAGAAVAVGLAADRGRGAARVLPAYLVGQLPWLVPGVVVGLQGVDPAGAEAFATRLDGPLGLLRVTGGGGFWIPDFDVASGAPWVPLAAVALVALAALGHRDLPSPWRGRALALALVGLAVALASGLPLVGGLYDTLADTALGRPLREGHRVLPLFLVWMVVAAAHGCRRVTDDETVAGLTGVGVAVALAAPATWGFGGQLAAVASPDEWELARTVVERDPGPVLALPWVQYVRPSAIDGRLVHQPLPYLLGGDVLIASGRALPDSPVERADPRLPTAGEIADRLRAGQVVGPQLRALGIRWVALVSTVDPTYPDLDADPALDAVVTGDELVLLAVEGWPGPTATPEGGPGPAIDPIVSPWARVVEGAGAFTWFRSGANGWRRGAEPVAVGDDGNLLVPAGSGPLWYWPTFLVLAADGITVGAVVAASRRGHRPR